MVGAALTLPDFNQVLAKLNGRLLPFGWATRCASASKSTRYGCSRSASSRSTSTPASPRASTRCTSTRPNAPPQKGGEWAGSSRPTKPMNRAMEGMGGEIVRRFRVYERSLV